MNCRLDGEAHAAIKRVSSRWSVHDCGGSGLNLHLDLTSFTNDSRTLRETRTVIESGLAEEVVVIALHSPGLQEHELIGERRSLWRVRLAMRRVSNAFAFQVLSYFELSLKVLWWVRGRKVSIVNVHCVDLLPLGVILKRVCGARLVYDAHELESEQEGLRGIRKRLALWAEARLIRHCDLVIVVSDAIRDHYANAHGHRAVVTVFNCPWFDWREQGVGLREAFGIADSANVFIYVGALIGGRGIDIVLDAFADADPCERVVVFMGYGPLEAVVRERSARCPAILFKPAVSPDQVLEVVRAADVGLVAIEDTCLSYRYCLPNKLFEYLMAGLPVIVSDLPELRAVVEREGVGVVLDEWSAMAIKRATEAVRPFLAQDRARREPTARRYSWETQAEVMVEAYRRFVTGPGPCVES